MKFAVLLFVILVATAMDAAANIVSTARLQSHQTNADLIARDPTLVYGLEFTRDPRIDPQSLSILLSTHPDAASGVHGAAKFMVDHGRIELRPGTIAMCSFKFPDDEDTGGGEDNDAQDSSTAPQEEVDATLNGVRIFQWWMIVFEDLEIGAEGTVLEIVTSPTGQNGEQQIAIVLREGELVRIWHRPLRLDFNLTRAPSGPDTVYVITWSPQQADRIRVNNHEVMAGGNPNAHQKLWLQHSYTDKVKVHGRIQKINDERTLLKNSP